MCKLHQGSALRIQSKMTAAVIALMIMKDAALAATCYVNSLAPTYLFCQTYADVLNFACERNAQTTQLALASQMQAKNQERGKGTSHNIPAHVATQMPLKARRT